MVGGNCRTWAAAAKRVGVARETLSRYLQRPECRQALTERAARAVAMSAGRASARLNQLLDSSSQRVALDATRLSLQAAGIVGSGQNVSVNVGLELRAGYVIDLRERDADGPPPVKVVEGAAGVVVDSKPATE
jgi:hypothetical protein